MPTATNPTTGERLQFVAGAWIPLGKPAAPGLGQIEAATAPAAPAEPGLLSRYVTDPLRRGIGQLSSAAGGVEAGTGLTTPQTAAEQISAGERYSRKFPRVAADEAAMQELGGAKTFPAFISALIRHPVAAFQAGVESLGPSAPSMIGGGIGALAGPTASAAGVGLGSAAVEFGSSIIQPLQDAGVDLLDTPKVARILADPEFMKLARDHAIRRGVPVGAFDAFAGRLAGQFVHGATSVPSFLARSVPEAVVQAGSGGVGEYAAEKASGEPVQPGQIGMEVVAEGPGIVPEVATGVFARRHDPAVAAAAARVVQRVQQGAPGATAPPPAGTGPAAPSPGVVGPVIPAAPPAPGAPGATAPPSPPPPIPVVPRPAPAPAVAPAPVVPPPSAAPPVVPQPPPPLAPAELPTQDVAIRKQAEESAAAILGEQPRWEPIPDASGTVTHYHDTHTGKIETAAEHLAPIPTPLSTLDPVVPSPAEVAAAPPDELAAPEAEKAGVMEPPGVAPGAEPPIVPPTAAPTEAFPPSTEPVAAPTAPALPSEPEAPAATEAPAPEAVPPQAATPAEPKADRTYRQQRGSLQAAYDRARAKTEAKYRAREIPFKEYDAELKRLGEQFSADMTELQDRMLPPTPESIARNKARKEAEEQGGPIKPPVGPPEKPKPKPAPALEPADLMDPARAYTREDTQPLTPANLARHLGTDQATAKKVLQKLAAKGEITQTKQGLYRRKGVQKTAQTFTQFVASLGGLTPRHRAEVPDAPRLVPGYGPLFRSKGLDPDAVREAAVEAGYLKEDAELNDVFKLLDDENRGKKTLRGEDQAAVEQARQDREAERDAERAADARDEVTTQAAADEVTLSDKETEQAVRHMLVDGLDASHAIESATMSAGLDWLEANPTISEPVSDDDIPFDDFGEAPAPAPAPAEPSEGAPAGEQAGAGARPPAGKPEAEAGGGPPSQERPQAGAKEEPGAEGLPQLILPGAEPSAEQAMAARKSKAKQAKVRQKASDEGIFAQPPDKRQTDIEEAAKLEGIGGTPSSTLQNPIQLASNLIAGNFSGREAERLRSELQTELEPALRRIAGPHADLSVFDALRFQNEAGEEGGVGGFNLGNLIGVALTDGGRTRTTGETGGTLRHEAIHFMRQSGLIPPAAWRALEAKAPKWRQAFGIDDDPGYADLSEAARNEEAVAEAFSRWHQGTLNVGETEQSGMRVIRRILRAIKEAVRKVLGLERMPTAEEVMQAIEEGSFADAGLKIVERPKGFMGGPRRFDVVNDDGVIEDSFPTKAEAMTAMKGLVNLTEEARFQTTRLAAGGTMLNDATDPEVYNRIETETEGFLDKVFRGKRADTEDTLDHWRRLWQDRILPWLRLQQKVEKRQGQPLPMSAEVHLAEELNYSSTKERMFRLMEDHVKPMLRTALDAGLNREEIGKYLKALGAKFRNDYVASINPAMPDGGSGMTNKAAQDILDAVAAGPAEKRIALEQIAERFQAMNRERTALLVESGRYTAADIANWERAYPFYVPYRGVEGDPDPEMANAAAGTRTGRGFLGGRRGEHKVTGRTSEAFDPLPMAIAMAKATIDQAGKNTVRKSIMNLAGIMNDPDVLELSPRKRQAFMRTITDQVTGQKIKTVGYRYVEDYDPTKTLSAWVGGREFLVKIKDPTLLESIGHLSGNEVPGLFSKLHGLMQFLSTSYTMLSPEFLLTNFVRDIQTAMINLGLQKNIPKLRSRVLKLTPFAIKGAYHYLATGKADTEMAKWVQDFRRHGGSTAFNQITDVMKEAKDIDAMLASLHGGPVQKTKAFLKQQLDRIENANTAIDYGVRVAVYRVLVEAKVHPSRAASIAKNLTVNFNRRGEYGAALNSLWLFSNASIQGTATLANAMYRSKNVRRLIAGTVAAGFAQEMLAALFFPPPDDDKDKTGMSGYDRIPEWEKQSNMIFPYGSGPGEYFKLPMPYGYNVFHNMGRLTAAYLRGAKEDTGKPVTAAKTIAKLTASFGQGFLPITSIIPTLGQPFYEVATNTDWTGRKIMPDRFPGDKTPDAYKQFESVSALSPPVARALNSMTGGDAYQAGEIDISPESIDHVVSFFMGGAINKLGELISNATKLSKEALGTAEEDPQFTAANIPFIRRVVGSASPWQLKDITYRRIEEVGTVKDRLDGEQDALKSARDPASKAAARAAVAKLRSDNRALLALDKQATGLQRQLSKMRKERLAILGTNQPAAVKRTRTTALRERERQAMTSFNKAYFNALRRDQAPHATAPTPAP